MADKVVAKKFQDGANTATFHFTNVSDGTGENNVAKVDVSALNTSDGKTCKEVAILMLSGAVSNPGGNVRPLYITWAGTSTDSQALVIPPNTLVDYDYSLFGGIRSTATGGTDDVLFTFPAATGGTVSAYDVTMTVRKKYA